MKQRGSILIVVLWVVFGLIAVTLYFAHSMTMDLRASDNRTAGIEAEQAIEGARRYMTCVLSNVNSSGVLPDPATYANQAVQVGNARYWLIGRGDGTDAATTAHFGLIDEASKLNLNSASSNMLICLPRMTPELVLNIMAWRSTNTTSLAGGAESASYSQLPQPYLCKNAPFESVDELRLVYQMDMTTLSGEDANLNGVLDPNENDGDALPPSDNMNGQLEPGLLEYVTVYSREPSTYTNMTSSGSVSNITRLNITAATIITDPTPLEDILITNGIASDRAKTIVQGAIATSPRGFTSPLAFYYAASSGTGKMTTTEFMQIENSIRGSNIVGLININTASATVLGCIPAWYEGSQAQQVVTYRQSITNSQNNLNTSVVWITQSGVSQQDVLNAAPYLTGKSYQFMADIAAVGHNGRGYRRTQYIYDTTSGTPVIVHRQDLSALGWALGKDVRDKYLLAKNTP
jgi:type II secretory pathway component PulK